MLLASVTDSVEHALNATLAEAAGNEDAVEALKLRLIGAVVGGFAFQALRFNPGDVELQILCKRAVSQGFLKG